MIYKLNPIMNNLKALYINDEPPKLYDLMNSYVNYDKEVPLNINDSIAIFKDYLFSFNYEIDARLKNKFEEMFLKHFIFRRIGFETFTAFQLHLEVKLNSIMPKYNKMLLEFTNLDFLGELETHTKTSNTKNVGSTTGSSSSTVDNRFSNLPQNEITDVSSGTYMTDYTLNTQTGSTSGTLNNIEDKNELINIHKGDSTDEYLKMQDKIFNIYDLIFKELDSLFFQVV